MAIRLRPVEHYSLRELREVWSLTALALSQDWHTRECNRAWLHLHRDD
ncbi:hypothetical protein [Pseudomonas putida]|jgi:hypothetical protein